MFTGQKPSDTLMVHLYRSHSSQDVSWDFYEDDGVTYQYQDGKYYQRKMTYKPDIKEVVFGEKSGNYESKFTYIQLVFHGFDDPEMMVKFEGKPRKNQPAAFDFNRAGEKIAPANAALSNLPSIVFPNENGKMVVSW
jgi:alpha-glucosidase